VALATILSVSLAFFTAAAAFWPSVVPLVPKSSPCQCDQ
jgi:hypothetical protein